VGQGRTDSGVHAEAQIAHFDFPDKLDSYQMLSAFLGVLPKDISVWKMENVDADFHARFHAIWLRYRYQFALRAMPLLRSTSEMVLGDLNIDAMHRCAGEVAGTHHFDNFTKPDNEALNATCDVRLSEF